MTRAPRNLLSLWDYGWCEHERIAIPRSRSPQVFIGEYLRSDAFGTGFVGPEPPYEPDLHGPFFSSLLSEPDFELITPQRFQTAIAAIPQAFTRPPSAEQWQAVEHLVSEVSSRHAWLFTLRLTEDDKDRFHEFGFVLWLFREFVCGTPDTEHAERLVFGYD